MKNTLKRLPDLKALIQSLAVNLAIAAIWYGFEWMQYGELQWGRQCDNVVGILYIFILWWAFHQNNVLLDQIVKICKQGGSNK